MRSSVLAPSRVTRAVIAAALLAVAAAAPSRATAKLTRGNVLVHKSFRTAFKDYLVQGHNFTVTYMVLNVGLAPAYDVKARAAAGSDRANRGEAAAVRPPAVELTALGRTRLPVRADQGRVAGRVVRAAGGQGRGYLRDAGAVSGVCIGRRMPPASACANRQPRIYYCRHVNKRPLPFAEAPTCPSPPC